MGFQCPATAVALEGNDQPGTLVAEPCMYRALSSLAQLYKKNPTTDNRQTEI